MLVIPETRPAAGEPELEAARDLFRAYAGSLSFSLDFQGFAEELARLPGEYAPPGGQLFLGFLAGEAEGCVALRPGGDAWAEIKRLYVRPGARGKGLGRLLAEAAVAEARRLGYARVRLDTVPEMAAAGQLYRSLGFQPIPPYRHNPLPGAVFLELRLE